MAATGISKSGPGDITPTRPAKQETSALAPSTETWIERMMRAGERMHRDEAFRQGIAKRLS